MITEQQTEALKPCPFCGGKAVHREYDDRHPYEAFGLVVDHSEACFLNLLRRQDGTFTAWDTRATPSPAPSDTLEREREMVAKAKAIAASVVQSACETDPADPGHPDTVCIDVADLEAIVRTAVANALEAAGGQP